MLKDVKRSRQMISELSEFLRYSLVSKNNIKISLKQEIEAVKHFCVIEKIRFEDRLEINFSIDSETENKLVPPLILHPLVENAIKYGMETNPNVLKVGIATFIENDKFVIEINNNGKWLDETERSKIRIAGTNTGLENVRQILQNTYYLKHSFAIFTDSGVKIKISIDLDEVTPNA
jgi:LytS/YehU family sensor histidine kinase